MQTAQYVYSTSGPTLATQIPGPDSALYVSSFPLDSFLNLPTGYTSQIAQPLRPGATASVTVTSSDTSIGTIVTTPLAFTGNTSSLTTAFHPLAVGATVVSISAPGFTTPSNYQTVPTTVTEAGISIANFNAGNNLQTTFTGSLAQPAPTGGVTVTITSTNPALLLSWHDPNADPREASSISVIVPEGGSYLGTLYANALAGTGSSQLMASAPGFSTGAATVTLVPSGFAVVANPSRIHSRRKRHADDICQRSRHRGLCGAGTARSHHAQHPRCRCLRLCDRTPARRSIRHRQHREQ